ncbi:MAG TPA: HAD family hydrolase [Vicinamibacteria bacterium]|nr:HAD family hydrolase [Vicinamibacteria bacterium]
MSPRPAIFMDRDGTLADEVGYVNDVSRFRLYPWAVEAVRLVNRSGHLAVMVTNQAGVARGYFPEPAVAEVHERVAAAMAGGAARLDGIYYCPHHPQAGQAPYRQDCDCRKPRPGLLTRAAADLDIDLSRSWVVGDRQGDLEVAWAVGARGAMVRTGYGRGELRHHAPRWPRQPDLVAEHLLEAVSRILAAPRA